MHVKCKNKEEEADDDDEEGGGTLLANVILHKEPLDRVSMAYCKAETQIPSMI